MQLFKLVEGQKAIIKHIGDLGELKRRLLELGVLCGEPVKVLRKSPFDSLIELEVKGEKFALRAEDAKKIEVELLTEDIK